MNIKKPIWQISEKPITYQEALQEMESYVDKIIINKAPNKIWLLEHFDIYTKGTSSVDTEILDNRYNIDVITTNRGGKITYHGVGQRIIYLMIDLNKDKDIKKYIKSLEKWIILTLKEFNINAFIKENMIGIWVKDKGKDKKIGAIGVRVKKWITYHGISVNIFSDLDKFQSIIPCGINNFGVSSLHSLEKKITFKEFDIALKKTFTEVFNEQGA